MTQTKTAYRTTDTELNFILQQIAARLDKIEGLKGNPKFYATAFDFEDAVTGFLQASAATTAEFSAQSAEDVADHDHTASTEGGDYPFGDVSAADVTTMQGLTASTRAFQFSDGTMVIHSMGV